LLPATVFSFVIDMIMRELDLRGNKQTNLCWCGWHLNNSQKKTSTEQNTD
jgi:hypothetical protein